MIQLAAPVFVGNQIQIDFTAANYRSGRSFQLWKATASSGPWTLDNTATITTVAPSFAFRAATQTGAAATEFYRVKGIY